MSKSVLVKGRNRETARALLDSAKRLGLHPSVVETSSRGGYLVPQEVYDGLGDAPGEDFTENHERDRANTALAPDEVADSGPSQDPESYEAGKESDTASTGAGVLDRPARTADDTETDTDEPKARQTRGRRKASSDTEDKG